MTSQTSHKTVNFEGLGISFTIPKRWTSQVDGDYLILKHRNILGVIIVFENRSKSVMALLKEANQGITEEGMQLSSLKDFKATRENKIEGHYQGVFLGTKVKAFGIGIINRLGTGLSVLAIAEPRYFEPSFKNEAQKLIESVVFKVKQVSKQTKFWKNRCVGKRLNYFNTQTNSMSGGVIIGISDKETIDLFNDGSFYYHTKNQSIVNSSQMYLGDNLSGDYRIATFEGDVSAAFF